MVLVGSPNPVAAQSGSSDSMSLDPERAEQAGFFNEPAVPADPLLHEAVVNGLTTRNRPQLPDDFLLTLRRTRQGEGTILVWEGTRTKLSVAGAHLAQYIILILPYVLPQGEHGISLGGRPSGSPNIYAIYAHTEVAWTPLFSCIGLAVDGDVILNKN